MNNLQNWIQYHTRLVGTWSCRWRSRSNTKIWLLLCFIQVFIKCACRNLFWRCSHAGVILQQHKKKLQDTAESTTSGKALRIQKTNKRKNDYHGGVPGHRRGWWGAFSVLQNGWKHTKLSPLSPRTGAYPGSQNSTPRGSSLSESDAEWARLWPYMELWHPRSLAQLHSVSARELLQHESASRGSTFSFSVGRFFPSNAHPVKMLFTTKPKPSWTKT